MHKFVNSCEITSNRLYFKKARKALNLSDIIMLQADVNYTTFYLRNGKRYVTSRSLKLYEILLETSGFIRIHKAFLINRLHLQEYDSEQDFVLMSNNLIAPISRRKRINLIN